MVSAQHLRGRGRKTREEAYANAKEAIELYLEVMREEELPIPTVERGRVAVAG